MILTAHMRILDLACYAVKVKSYNLHVGELLLCVLHSGLLSVDSICNLLVLMDGTLVAEG